LAANKNVKNSTFVLGECSLEGTGLEEKTNSETRKAAKRVRSEIRKAYE